MPFHDKSCSCGRCVRERRNRGTQSLGMKIALQGGQITKGQISANWVPYCLTPVRINRIITSREAVDELKPMEVSMDAPCRRCRKCLQFRKMRWRERALSEVSQAKRTWWVTLTFSPIHLAGILLEAKGTEIKDIEAAAYRHVQRFFKRLRKGTKASEIGDTIIRKPTPPAVFRYLAVYERGDKYGRSHYHLFLHETGSKPMTKAIVEAQWHSIIHMRLVRGEDARGRASYLTEYATKEFDIRPRASNGYGKLSSP